MRHVLDGRSLLGRRIHSGHLACDSDAVHAAFPRGMKCRLVSLGLDRTESLDSADVMDAVHNYPYLSAVLAARQVSAVRKLSVA
jgi:hypothetical protein